MADVLPFTCNGCPIIRNKVVNNTIIKFGTTMPSLSVTPDCLPVSNSTTTTYLER